MKNLVLIAALTLVSLGLLAAIRRTKAPHVVASLALDPPVLEAVRSATDSLGDEVRTAASLGTRQLFTERVEKRSTSLAWAPPMARARLNGRITRSSEGTSAQLEIVAGPNRGLRFATAADGSLRQSELHPGWALVEVTLGSARVQRELRLRPGANPPFDLDFAPGEDVRGEVLGNDEQPLIGAEVSFDGQTTTTNGRGEYQMARLASGVGLLTVHSPGRTPYCERLLPGATPAQVRMEAGAALEIQIGESPRGGGEVHLYLFPTAGERLTGRMPGPAYPWHELNPVRTTAGTTLVLEDLPTTRVDVVALHAEARGGPVHGWLVPGRDATMRVPLLACPRVVGRVLSGGRPAVGAHVTTSLEDPLRGTLDALGSGSRFLLSQPIELLPGVEHSTRTDGQGNFSLPRWNSRRSTALLTVDHRGMRDVLRLGNENAIEVLLDSTP